MDWPEVLGAADTTSSSRIDLKLFFEAWHREVCCLS